MAVPAAGAAVRAQQRQQRAAGARLALLLAVAGLLALSLERHGGSSSVAAGEAALRPAFLGLGERRDVIRIAQAAFPGSMPGNAVMSRALKAVRSYGLTRTNTIYGQSICPDEINSDPGHLTTLLTKYYGRTFPLGGLGGAAFAGKTGFMAFSHHVPDGGHVFVVFGPHIGYTPTGEPSKFLRPGQAAVSTACGALNAAYAQLTSGSYMPYDKDDMQQSWLRERLKPHMPDIVESSSPMVELVMKAYSIVEEQLLSIVNTDYGPGNLVLLGGVAINMPYPSPGYFMPLHFSVRSAGKGPIDLMSTFQR